MENFSQIVQSTLVQVGGLYAVSQACLLAIFVPQKCPMIIPCTSPPQYNCDGIKLEDMLPADRQAFIDSAEDPLADCCLSSTLFTYTVFSPDGHLCTMKENLDWENCSTFNQSVLVLNLVTLFIMLMAQSFFWKREVWMINHLEEDNTVPYSSLPEQIQPYEELEHANKSYNRSAFMYACAVMLSVMCNFGICTYFLMEGDEFYNYNIGSRTITGLLTNTMLVSTKVIGYVSYARLSKTHDWAISMFSVIPVSYNVVDETYALNHAKTEGALKEARVECHHPRAIRRPSRGVFAGLTFVRRSGPAVSARSARSTAAFAVRVVLAVYIQYRSLAAHPSLAHARGLSSTTSPPPHRMSLVPGYGSSSESGGAAPAAEPAAEAPEERAAKRARPQSTFTGVRRPLRPSRSCVLTLAAS